MSEAEEVETTRQSKVKTANISLFIAAGAAIGGGGAALSTFFVHWGHEATGLSEWLIAPFAVASASAPAWHLMSLLHRVVFGRKKA